MKTSVRGSKVDGSMLASALCIMACLSMLMFVCAAVLCAEYHVAKKQYDSFYQNGIVYEVD